MREVNASLQPRRPKPVVLNQKGDLTVVLLFWYPTLPSVSARSAGEIAGAGVREHQQVYVVKTA
jgi:hypothetical protein